MPRKPKAQVPHRVTESPIRLQQAEDPQVFAKRIKHLSQGEIRDTSIATLLRLLVTKGVLTQVELQQAFLDEMERKGL